MNPEYDRLVDVRLKEDHDVRRRPEVEHERAVAIFDLLEENQFDIIDDDNGPYILVLYTQDDRLVFDVRNQMEQTLTKINVPMKAFKKIVKDYFLICESYFDAIRHLPPSRIEAIDMGRRGLHNEGGEILANLLKKKVEIDLNTARRLFTLVCVLHIKG